MDELESLNQEYDDILRHIKDLEELKEISAGDPGAYTDCVHDLLMAYDRLERLTQQIEAVFFARKQVA